MGDMEVVVTGGAGFIGSHLTEVLVNKDVYVKVIDNISQSKGIFKRGLIGSSWIPKSQTKYIS
ncbi:MAG: GDP-mannose 4,6-dehydratase [Halobacteria archaeon]